AAWLGAATTLARPPGVPEAPTALAPGASPLPLVLSEQYELGLEVSRGGQGRIVRARDKRLDRPVAIKELLSLQGPALPRFMQEARVTARLQHPGIVPIYEAGCWESGEPFYAMKMVEGQNLGQVISQATSFAGRLALLPHVIAACEAMAYAHSKGI